MTLIAALISFAIPGIMQLNAKLTLTLLAMGYFGIFMAIINSAMVGYVSSIQDRRAMSVYMLGCSTNSLMVLVIQIFCLLVFTNSLLAQSIVYFGATAFLLVLTCVCFVYLSKKYKIQESNVIEWSAIKEVYAEIWPEALSIMLVYCVSLTCYPGLFLNLKWWQTEEPWRSVMVVGMYNTCDSIGRFIPSWVQGPSKQTLRYLAIARILIVLTTILALPTCGLTYLEGASWYSLLNLVASGFTNGMIGTWLMIKGTSGTKQPEVGGYIMAFHLTVGLALGSVFAALLALALI